MEVHVDMPTTTLQPQLTFHLHSLTLLFVLNKKKSLNSLSLTLIAVLMLALARSSAREKKAQRNLELTRKLKGMEIETQ
jgi:hypothetical protein